MESILFKKRNKSTDEIATEFGFKLVKTSPKNEQIYHFERTCKKWSEYQI